MATSYQATEWNTGDTITKDKMNKIEKGIETNSKEFGNYATRIELSDYIPNSAKGVSVATLENGKIPMSQIPDSDTGQTISGYVKNVTSDGNATLTITTDSSPHNITINNVKNAVNAEVATKATQDSEGNIIKDVYFNIKKGIVNGGYIASGGSTFRIKNQSANVNSGNGFILTGGEIGFYDWKLNEYVLRISVGSKSVMVSNPDNNDDSARIATTHFVKAQSASMQVSALDTNDNYWVKEPSGLITQFVEVEVTTEEIEVPLPLLFSHKCLFVDVDVLNQEKDTSMDVKFNTIEKGLNSVKLLKIGTGTPKITVRVQGV